MSGSALLFDGNVWLPLAFAQHAHHQAAVVAFRTATRAVPAVFCRATQQTFLRLASNHAFLRLVGATGLTNRDALLALDRFLSAPTVSYRDEPSGLVPIWRQLATCDTASPKVWMDAYLAAFAIAGKMRFVTFDRGFQTFERYGLALTLLQSAAQS